MSEERTRSDLQACGVGAAVARGGGGGGGADAGGDHPRHAAGLLARAEARRSPRQRDLSRSGGQEDRTGLRTGGQEKEDRRTDRRTGGQEDRRWRGAGRGGEGWREGGGGKQRRLEEVCGRGEEKREARGSRGTREGVSGTGRRKGGRGGRGARKD
eukprot:1235240-Rhodomonas_salina.1